MQPPQSQTSTARARRSPRRRAVRGFTAVELCLLLSGLGVLLAMALPTFFETLQTSKTAEASEHLARMVAGASSYYAAFHDLGARRATHCLPDPAGPVPAMPAVDPVAVRFGADATPGAETWRALGFLPPHPVRYSYVFAPGDSGCQLSTRGTPVRVLFIAQGDLDGDGNLSEFRRVATTGPNGLDVDPLLTVDQRIE